MPIGLGNAALKQIKEELMVVTNPLEQNSPDMHISTVIWQTCAPSETAKETVPIFRYWQQSVTTIIVEKLVQPAQLSPIQTWQGGWYVRDTLHGSKFIRCLPYDRLWHVHQ